VVLLVGSKQLEFLVHHLLVLVVVLVWDETNIRMPFIAESWLTSFSIALGSLPRKSSESRPFLDNAILVQKQSYASGIVFRAYYIIRVYEPYYVRILAEFVIDGLSGLYPIHPLETLKET
jgi:hypothetical protein